MRKNFLSTYFLLLSFLLLQSCNKDISMCEPTKMETEDKVVSWLNNRITKAQSIEKKARILSLKEKLVFSAMRTEEFQNDEKFILIPLSDGISSIHNVGKQKSSTLVLVLNKEGDIRKGNIVQYIPTSGSTSLPKESISNIFNFRKIDKNSTFTFLNFSDKKLYEYTYENGELTRQGVMKAKEADKTSREASRTQEGSCVHWYWVTTYPDGSKTYEYAFTVCECNSENCAGNDEYEEETPEGSGGDGSDEYEYGYIAHKSWTAYTSSDGYNKLHVTDWLYGILAPNNGNRLTKITNQDISILNQFSSDHSSFATWYLYTGGRVTSVSSNGKTGTTTVKGKIKWPNNTNHPDKEIDETKSWNADVDLY